VSTSAIGTPNEKILLKKNSMLQEQTDELKNEVMQLREQLRRQQ
jgi:hypothetical protein